MAHTCTGMKTQILQFVSAHARFEINLVRVADQLKWYAQERRRRSQVNAQLLTHHSPCACVRHVVRSKAILNPHSRPEPEILEISLVINYHRATNLIFDGKFLSSGKLVDVNLSSGI